MTFTVPAAGTYGGMSGGQLKWSWAGNTGVDVIGVWDLQGTVESPLLVAQDVEGDGIPGFRMVDGPWTGFSVNLTNVSMVPVPAALWLFGSGLLGLACLALSRKHVLEL